MVDVTYEPFYGGSGSPYIHLYRPVKGCVGYFEYLTASILIGDKRCFIDALPVHRLASKVELLETVKPRKGFRREGEGCAFGQRLCLRRGHSPPEEV